MYSICVQTLNAKTNTVFIYLQYSVFNYFHLLIFEFSFFYNNIIHFNELSTLFFSFYSLNYLNTDAISCHFYLP